MCEVFNEATHACCLGPELEQSPHPLSVDSLDPNKQMTLRGSRSCLPCCSRSAELASVLAPIVVRMLGKSAKTESPKTAQLPFVQPQIPPKQNHKALNGDILRGKGGMCTHTCIYTYIYMYVCVYINMLITYTHTYIYTHVFYIHMHTICPNRQCFLAGPLCARGPRPRSTRSKRCDKVS